MKIFETRTRLEQNEYAYFIQCDEGYLCISNNESDDSMFGKSYIIGKLYKFRQDEINEIIKDLNEKILRISPLKNNFLFKHFLKGLK